MDKDNESYLDELLETFGQEPPYETDRRRKATDRAKLGKNRGSSKNDTLDTLEEDFDLDDLDFDDLDDSFFADIDLDELADPFEKERLKIEGDSLPESGPMQGAEAEKEPLESPVSLIEEEEIKEPVLDEVSAFDSNNAEEITPDLVSDIETESAAEGEVATELDSESREEIESVFGSEIGEEIEGDFGSEIGEEIGTGLGEEIGTEIGGEIADEIGFEANIEPVTETTSATNDEVGFEMGQEVPAGADINFAALIGNDAEIPLPTIDSLDNMGEPEILSEKEISKKSKTEKKAKKEKVRKEGGFSNLIKKLFHNIPLTDEELAALPSPEEEEAAKKQKEEEAAKTKEEKKAAAAEAKKKKAEEAKKKAADAKAKKQAKDAEKKAKKKEAELKRLRAEALEKPEGKINKAGAAIIFLFFAVAAAVVIVGTSLFSYDISIADATYKFGNRKYTEAYEGIRGLTIKDKDMELHDKIYTVMFVNKQLNSYNNFFAMGDYADALDSLIKGLKRYDKYIALATQLGIYSDLVYVRGQIMAELSEVYGITERDALELMDMTDKQGYSENIYTIIAGINTKAIAEQNKNKEPEPEFVP